jgi:hypothetical protein
VIDKKVLKKTIDTAKPTEILVLSVNKLDKNSLQMCQKEIDKFIKKQEDCVITVIRK